MLLFISSDHNYRNSSVVADLAMRQIPCSRERISS